MKPSERIKDIADGYFANYPEAIMFFLDEQAELLETHTVKEEEKDNYGKCSCDGKGICKKLGDVLKLILEVNWSEDVKLKEMDKVITEHYFTPQSNSEKEECCRNLCHCDDDAIGHFTGVEGCHKEEKKEEHNMVRCEHGLIAGDECDCGKDYHNEEPATPKKKCCDNCYLIIDSYPSIDSCGNINCQCHQEKLQTYFYKVTCGRCEKSIKLKHSCGRV